MSNKVKAYRPYTINVLPFSEGGSISLQDQANGVSFYNAGNTIAYVSGMPILPFTGWTPFEPNDGEIDITNYNVRFDPGNVATPQDYLLVIRKTYQEQ